MVRVFAHGVMGHQIDHSWSGPIELFLVSAIAPHGMCMWYGAIYVKQSDDYQIICGNQPLILKMLVIPSENTSLVFLN